MPAGLIFSIMVMVVAVLALSSGNNLLYILVSLLVASLIFSLFASRAVLSRIDFQLRYPERVVAGEAATFALTLVNRRRLLPVTSLTVALVEQPPGSWKRTRFDYGYLPLLPRRTEALVARERSFARRGVWRIRSVRLESRFPFGLFEHRRSMVVEGTMRVHPPVRSLRSSQDGRFDVAGREESVRRGSGGELYSIRDSPGTDPRHHIDWKATARTGHLKVREFTSEDDQRVTIVFDYAVDEVPERLSEAGVLLVAGLVDSLIRAGATVRLVTRTGVIPFGSGPKQTRAIFDQLAELPPPHQAVSGQGWLEVMRSRWKGVFSSGREEVPAEEAATEDWRELRDGQRGRIVAVVPNQERAGQFKADVRVSTIRCDQLPAEFIEFVDGTEVG